MSLFEATVCFELLEVFLELKMVFFLNLFSGIVLFGVLLLTQISFIDEIGRFVFILLGVFIQLVDVFDVFVGDWIIGGYSSICGKCHLWG